MSKIYKVRAIEEIPRYKKGKDLVPRLHYEIGFSLWNNVPVHGELDFWTYAPSSDYPTLTHFIQLKTGKKTTFCMPLEEEIVPICKAIINYRS